MVRALAVLIVVALWAVAALQDCQAEDAKGEFEGTWDLIYLEHDGKEVKPQPNTKAINTAGRFSVKVGDKIVASGTSKLDPSQKPKTLDLTYTDGPDKGKTLKGIYEVDGDMARFCRAATPEQDRPTEFKTSASSPGLVSKYRRAKP